MKCIDDEIPFEVPETWKWCRLRNLILGTGAGKSPNCDKRPKKDNEWGVLTTTAIQYCDFLPNENKVLPTNYIVNEDQEVKYNDLLITRAGPRNRTGVVCVANKACSNLILSDKTVRIEYVRDYCNPYYLMFALNSPVIHDNVMSATVGMADSQVNISQNSIQNIAIPLPPYKEQENIVNKLNTVLPYLKKYSIVKEQQDKLNENISILLKKSILQEAIQGKLVPQDPNDEPASVLLERIKGEKAKLFKEGKLKKKDLVDSVIFKGEDNKYYETIDGKTECIDECIPFELPHNWCWATLGNLVQNCSGLAYKKENLDERSTSYIRVLRGGNIDDGQWMMKDDDVMIASKFVKPELLLTAGTFITPAVTSIEQMGKTALVRDDQPQTVVGGFVLMLLPFLRDWSLLDYLELIFQSEYYKGYCRSITNKSGQAFYNLSRQKLMQFLVPLPPLNERIIIAEYVAKINSMMR